MVGERRVRRRQYNKGGSVMVSEKNYERITMRILEDISSGKLRPGDRLPPEMDLAKDFGVSRPTAREALKVLQAMNILRSSTGPTGGTFIREIDGTGVAEYLKDAIALLLSVSELTLEQLYEARESIEISAAAMAAKRRTEKDLAELERVIESDELKDSDTVISDISFHRAIATASKNEMFRLFMSSIHMTIRTIADRYILPEAKKLSQHQHEQIYEAILDRDENRARSRMQEHLKFAAEVYRQAIPKTIERVPEGNSLRPYTDGE